jgi:hypothetical protein
MSAVLLAEGTDFIDSHLRAVLRGEPMLLLGGEKPALGSEELWRYADMAEPLVPKKLEGRDAAPPNLLLTGRPQERSLDRHLHEAVNACRSTERVFLTSSVAVYRTTVRPL